MLPNRTVRAIALLVLPLALTACEKAAQPADPASEAAVSGEAAGPEAKPGMAASGGRLVLPIIAGRPGAAYVTVTNSGTEASEIAGIWIDGVGKAEMHRTEGGSMARLETLPLSPGTEAVFAPGGNHIMAFDIDPKLKAGGTTEMTITFAGGDKLSTPVKVEAMGAAAGSDPMAGMQH